MDSELAMNAYVLLGNTLHYLKRSAPASLTGQLGEPQDLEAVVEVIEPLPPNRILEGYAQLGSRQRDLLDQAIQLSLSTLGSEAESVLGLPAEVIQETLSGLKWCSPNDPGIG
jgi:hypothetical protein